MAPENEPIPNAKNDIGDCFLRLAALPTFPLDRLSRYEHLLWRQARQIVFTLESFRRRKQAAEPLKLSIFVPAARAQNLRRVQVRRTAEALPMPLLYIAARIVRYI